MPDSTRTMPRALATLIVVLLLTNCESQAQSDVHWTFEGATEYASAYDDVEFGELSRRVGEYFIGAPYEAGMLDREAEESLVETFDRFDCVLFVETVLALAQGVAVSDLSRSGFSSRLATLRYRKGTREGYCSRLHYFSEWIADNELKGLVHDLTAELGVPWSKSRSFMTDNRGLYPRLAESDSLFLQMQQIEARLADEPLFLVPRDSLHRVLPRLESGDIVAFATPIGGLDVTHTGIVWVSEDGRRGMIHASSPRGVRVSSDLQSYLANNESALGIFVARPIDPRQESPRP